MIFEQQFQRQSNKRYYRSWKKFDKDKFSDEFSSINWEQKLEQDKNNPDLAFINFFDSIETMIDKHAPIKKLSRRQQKRMDKPWITKGLKTSMQVRENLLELSIKEKNEDA